MNAYQKKRIIALLDCPDLTDWEYDFINNLAKKDEDYELTKSQNHWLNKVAQKHGR